MATLIYGPSKGNAQIAYGLARRFGIGAPRFRVLPAFEGVDQTDQL
jgi:hypothetical protein